MTDEEIIARDEWAKSASDIIRRDKVLALLSSVALWGWRTVSGQIGGTVFPVTRDILHASQAAAEASHGSAVFRAVPVLRFPGIQGEIELTADAIADLGPCPNL